MTFRAGDIVTLKSGGQALTIASVDAEDANCIWLGEEGDLFRETIPIIALEAVELDEEDEEEGEDEEASADEGEDEEEAG
ncbi:YodC family protein [Phreatobacter sp. HK31-P]